MRRVGRIPVYRPTQGYRRRRRRQGREGCSPYETWVESDLRSHRRRMTALLVFCGSERWEASYSPRGRIYHSFVTECCNRRVLFLLFSLLRHGHGVPDVELLPLGGSGEQAAESEGATKGAGEFRDGRCTPLSELLEFECSRFGTSVPYVWVN